MPTYEMTCLTRFKLQRVGSIMQATGVYAFCAQDITTRNELVLAYRLARNVNVDTCLSGL